MKPYYEDEYVTLYHGDCRDVLPSLSLGQFSLLTDPPYGHGKKWTGGGYFRRPIYAGVREWDAEPFDNAALLALIAAVGGPSVIWGGNYYALPPSRCWLAWEKSSKMDTMADFELAWTSLDQPAKLFREDRNPDGERQHPTQKPLSLMQWSIGFLDDSTAILDPFAGSGSSLRAAKDLNRKAVGVEREEKFCRVIAARLAQNVLDFGAA